MLTVIAKIGTAVLLLSIFYWAHYVDKNKKDERSEKIIGKSSKYSFSFTYILLGFFSIFYLNGYIDPKNVFNFLVIIIALMSLVNSLFIFILNKKMG